MSFQSITPILYSSDVVVSIRYYTDVLGFKGSWTWDDPVGFGGVDMGDVRIFFCRDGQGHPGTWLAINVDDVDAYHELISAKGAKVINPPESFEWGMREMLVEDPDGHRIRFGHGISLRGKSEPRMPDNIQIASRPPSADELEKLIKSVGWGHPAGPRPATGNSAAIAHCVIAKNYDNAEVVGCAFLFSDSAGFYYIKNVIVHPEWQGKLIGTALVKNINDWFEENAPDHSTIALHTGPNLAHFYRRFGFSTAFSMQKNKSS
ncbi:GNAT family N-acetyltransferase [Flavitalea sp.]|nr:GNAT family N-acetyltransferase [Flavitalea sp.]